MRGRLVGRTGFVMLGLGVLIGAISSALPGDVAFVPECVALWTAVLLIAIVVVYLVLARQIWLWLRWRSVAISIPLLFVAAFPATPLVEDLTAQLRPPPSEGFMYRGGFGICGTYVVSASTMTERNERLYVLERHCIPDGLEERTTYVRNGRSILMRKALER
jgi:hypothetical protein